MAKRESPLRGALLTRDGHTKGRPTKKPTNHPTNQLSMNCQPTKYLSHTNPPTHQQTNKQTNLVIECQPGAVLVIVPLTVLAVVALCHRTDYDHIFIPQTILTWG